MPKRVLLVVEDPALAELLAEALVEVGHVAHIALDGEMLAGHCPSSTYDAAVVDLDTRERAGLRLVERLRHRAPAMRVIALFPCGGVASEFASVHYHFAIEKPARMQAVLAALEAATVQVGLT